MKKETKCEHKWDISQKLVQGFYWKCKKCGKEEFVRAIKTNSQ